MGRTIGTIVASGVVLAATDDPLSITAGGEIDSTDVLPGLIAETAAGPWQISNDGTIESRGAYGIVLLSAGAIDNGPVLGGALVDAAVAGVVALDAATTIANLGTVSTPGFAAIWLEDGGLVANGTPAGRAAATLSGAVSGLFAGGSVTIENGGTITAASGFGAILLDGGDIGNGTTADTAANITGAVDGIANFGGSGTLTNAGVARGGAAFGAIFAAGGTIANTGQILGGWSGAYLTGGPANISNAGTIGGTNVGGIWADSPVTVVNSAGGLIDGGINGITATGGLALTNAGTISAQNDFGVLMLAGGTVTNSGVISAPVGLLAIQSAPGTADVVIDSGLIASSFGAGGTALLFAGPGARLDLLPGARFAGNVVGAGNSTLELAAAAAAGSIAGLGGAFSLFQTVSLDAGANWVFSGTNDLSPDQTLMLAGTATLGAGALFDDEGALTGSGSFDLGGAGTQTLILGPSTGAVAGAAVATPLRDIGAGDRLDFSGIAITGTPSALVATVPDGTPTAVTIGDGAGGTLLTLSDIGFATIGVIFTARTDPANGDLSIVATPGTAATASVTAALTDITGPAGSALTRDPTIGGTINAQAGVESFSASIDGAAATSILGNLGAGGSFTLGASSLAAIDGGTLPDGTHDVRLTLTDGAGHVATADVVFTLDTAAPALRFQVASAFDMGDAPGTTGSGTVTLMGTTSPGAIVTMAATGARVTADSSGAFSITGVPLAQGANTLTLAARNAAGDSTTQQDSITFAPGASNAPVIFWDQVTQNAVMANASDPYAASRAYALESVAVLDAINGIRGVPGYYVSLPAPVGMSGSVALAGAAYAMLANIFPGQTASLQASLAQSIAGAPPGTLTNEAVAYGEAVGNAVAARRANDGYDIQVVFNGPAGVGDWVPTPPGFLPALDPNWASVTPYVMSSPTQFPAPPPPAVDSPAYEAALAQVESLGQGTSTTRTADETQIAKFWNDQPGSFTPTGQWDSIIQAVASNDTLDLADTAAVLADTNLAMGDAGIEGASTKYEYDYWRPVTAIEEGDSVNAADPGWLPLLTTPNFPSYDSGHALFSGDAATVLQALVGPSSFSITSSSLPGVTRGYTSFGQAAQEAMMSRIYGGIHFIFDGTEGLAQGAAIGSADLGTLLDTTLDRGPFLNLDQPGPFIVTTGSLALTGEATDNIAPITTLSASLDGGVPQAIAVSAAGTWALNVSRFGALSAGAHALDLSVTDVAGEKATLDVRFGAQVPLAGSVAPVTAASVATGAATPGFVAGTNTSASETAPLVTSVALGAVTAALFMGPAVPPAAVTATPTMDTAGISATAMLAGAVTSPGVALPLPGINQSGA